RQRALPTHGTGAVCNTNSLQGDTQMKGITVEVPIALILALAVGRMSDEEFVDQLIDNFTRTDDNDVAQPPTQPSTPAPTQRLVTLADVDHLQPGSPIRVVKSDNPDNVGQVYTVTERQLNDNVVTLVKPNGRRIGFNEAD